MKELEKLPNTLIEKGWNPRGIEWVDIDFFNLDMKRKIIHIWYMDYSNPEKEIYEQEFKAFRELVSLESWLWNFLCDNKLIKQTSKEWVLNPTYWPEWADCDWSIQSNEAQYRLLESALLPEEELGKFLVENIKIED